MKFAVFSLTYCIRLGLKDEQKLVTIRASFLNASQTIIQNSLPKSIHIYSIQSGDEPPASWRSWLDPPLVADRVLPRINGT